MGEVRKEGQTERDVPEEGADEAQRRRRQNKAAFLGFELMTIDTDFEKRFQSPLRHARRADLTYHSQEIWCYSSI